MQTATEVTLENSQQEQFDRKFPRIYTASVLGTSCLASIWVWAAFLRGRNYPRWLQVLFFLATLGCLIALTRLLAANLRRRFLLNQIESTRILAFSASALLLFAVFFPEYLLGKPVLARSLILLGLALALFAAYIKVSLRAAFPSSRTSPRFSASIALLLFCAAYFFATSWIALVKLHAFGYVGQDIAYFTQCLYTTLHGHLFYSNMYHDLLYGKAVSSDLASHNQLVLFLFLPFYLLYKSAATLLLVRNLFIVLCAWPVYLIVRRFLSPWLAAAAAIAFLLIPAVLYQNFYDFAPLSLAALPLLFALYYFLERRFRPYLIALLCAQIVREDLVFAIFGLGMLALWQRRSIRWVAIPCGLALAWALLSWKIVFPWFLQGATPAVASCFSYLGASPAEMIVNIFRHPRLLLTHTVVVYFKQLVDSFGGVLFLLNPAWIISLPYIAINVLAQGGGCNTAMIYRHYSLVPTVFLFGSVLLALEKKTASSFRKDRAGQTAIILFVLAAALSSTVFVTGQQQLDDLKTRPWHHEATQVAAMLPPDASVAVPRYMLPSVANRESLYQSLRLLEYHHPDAQYVVIDKDWERMAATAQWRENYDALRHLLETAPQYKVIYSSSNYLVYKLCDGCAANLPHSEPMKEMHD